VIGLGHGKTECHVPMTNCCPVTRGRHLYERWLWKMWISPDDLWDYLPEDERMAWEQLALEAGSR
jgi:hypothetical protein